MIEQTYDFSRLFMDYYDTKTQNNIEDYGNYWINKTTNLLWYK